MGLLFAVVIALLISPIRIWVDYRHRGKTEDTLLVKVGLLWGLSSFSVQVPVISTSIKGVEVQAEAGKDRRMGLSLSSLGEIFGKLRTLNIIKGPGRMLLKFFRRSITVQHFVWHTEIGIWDCAHLAQLCGALWAAKGMACAWLHTLFALSRPPVLRVYPKFNRSYFRTALSCILEFPLGYAIIVAFCALYLALKLKLIKRGGENVRTSNSRADENSHGEYQGDGGRQYSNR